MMEQSAGMDPSFNYDRFSTGEETSIHTNIIPNNNNDTSLKKKKSWFPQRNEEFSILFSSYVLFLLLFIFTINVTNRLVVSVMLPYMKKQLRMTDEQAGQINGPIYSVVSCVSGLLYGKLSELIPRKWVIVASILLSSVIMIITGLSWTYWYLFMCRLAFAATVSGVTACAIPFLADFFPPYHRASMQAVYNWGIFIGIGLGYAVGGIENSDFQDSESWRFAFYFLSVPAIFVALLLLITVKEPEKGRFEDLKKKMNIELGENLISSQDRNEQEIDGSNTGETQKRKLRQYTETVNTLSYLSKCPTFILICLGGSCRAFAALAMATWLPQFYVRELNINSVIQARWLSWIIPLGGISGFVFGGFLTDRWTKRDNRAAAYIAFIGSFLSIPCILCVLLIENPLGSIFFIFPNMMVGEIWTASAGLIILNILPVAMRTLSYPIYYFTFSIIGGFGPLLIGRITTHHNLSLKKSLLIVLPIFYFVAACFFLLAAFTLRRDTNEKNTWESNNATVERSHVEDMSTTVVIPN
jgi:MFS family permease